MLLFRYLAHPHIWVESKVNRWQIAFEEKCALCGKYRHHLYSDRFGRNKNSRWRKGPFLDQRNPS